MTEYAENPRADVNQDGRVDAGDLLVIRRGVNWNRSIEGGPADIPPPPSEGNVRIIEGDRKRVCREGL